MRKWRSGFLPLGGGQGGGENTRDAFLGIVCAVPFLIAAVRTQEEKKPSEPLKTPPRAYFAAHCQRCHGVDGSNYAPGFANEPETKLRADIVRMASGAGAAPLKAEDVEVQMAYHRLISDARPFVSWISRDGLVLKGEVSDFSDLTSNVGQVKVDDDRVWTLTLPSEADFAKLRLTATMEKKTTVFAPSETPFAKPAEKNPDGS